MAGNRRVVRVLFVCTGNICRSPTAEGVLRAKLVERGLEAAIEVDSAGTHAYHVGEPPDARTRQTARRRGVDLDGQRARQVVAADFSRFDHVLAMDLDNLAVLERLCPPEHAAKLGLLLDLAPSLGEREVPDPYYGRGDGFERVFDLVDGAAEALLDRLVDEGR